MILWGSYPRRNINMAELSRELKELLRNQVPFAVAGVPSNLLIVFLEELLTKVESLEAEVE